MPLTVSLEVPARSVALPRTGAGFELVLALALLLVVSGALLVRAAR